MPTYKVGQNADCLGRISILNAKGGLRKVWQASGRFGSRTASIGS